MAPPGKTLRGHRIPGFRRDHPPRPIDFERSLSCTSGKSTYRRTALTQINYFPFRKWLPNVERFGACIDSDTDATGALGACLRTWSSSLRHLSLESDTTNVAFAWPYLHELRSLFVFSTIVPPDALLNFEHLEFLVYYCAVEDLERLANILTEGEKPWPPVFARFVSYARWKVGCQHRRG